MKHGSMADNQGEILGVGGYMYSRNIYIYIYIYSLVIWENTRGRGGVEGGKNTRGVRGEKKGLQHAIKLKNMYEGSHQPSVAWLSALDYTLIVSLLNIRWWNSPQRIFFTKFFFLEKELLEY